MVPTSLFYTLEGAHTRRAGSCAVCTDCAWGRFSSRQREGRSWVLYESLVYSVLVVASLLWLLQVVVCVTLVPHVVVAFAAFLRRFAEDPPTTIDFLVPKQGTSLSSLAARRIRIDIHQR